MEQQKQHLSRNLLTIAMLGIVLVSTGCSFVIGFNIKNLSDQTITVRYLLKDLRQGLALQLVQQDSGKAEHIPLPEDRLSIDAVSRVVEFRMLPNEEVQLFQVLDNPEYDYEEEMKLSNLHIIGKDGSIRLEGSEVFKSFHPVESGSFSFGPKIRGFVLEYR